MAFCASQRYARAPPNCELCDVDLPPEALNARICSYECTYCAACSEGVLQNVCPTCGGGFAARPVRPREAYHHPHISLGLGFHPASQTRKHSRWSPDEIAAMTARLKDVPPEER